MSDAAPTLPDPPQRVLLAGATGYIGRFVARELVRRGHEVLAVVRPTRERDPEALRTDLPGCTLRLAPVTDRAALAAALEGERIDAVVSCIATRSGEPRDAWRVEHEANGHLLAVARDAGARRFVLLSAICVQRPTLAFQHAKLAFEAELQASGLGWSIVRPTAFFKSLAGQVERVRAGKPFLV
ncbi:MAG: NAD(P)H-binding protein, partial [Pseudomonadales bacterium]|nr:NAD(P)H-binding protein [Pseudomonadales bacterium]